MKPSSTIAIFFIILAYLVGLASCATTHQANPETEQAHGRQWATAEMLKSLNRIGLSEDRYDEAVAIVDELRRTDPGWFQRTSTSIQFDEIALMLKERVETGRITALDDRIVNSLTTDEWERSWLRFKQARHPERRHDVQYLQAALASSRDYTKRYQVQRIKMRHQYPNATDKEIHILAHDEVTKERRAAREAARMAGVVRALAEAELDPEPMFMPMIHCTSMNLGVIVDTSCY